MAAGTASLITGGLGMAMGGIQALGGDKMKRNAQRELNSYQRQDLDNAFENIQISTLGSDLLKEETQRRSAGFVDALQGGGIRGVVGGIPKVVATMNAADMQAAKLLDDQFINRQYAIAEDNARIEGITENRDINNINALSSQVNAGRQDAMNGLMGIASGAAFMGRSITPTPPTPAPNPASFDSGMMYNFPQPDPGAYTGGSFPSYNQPFMF